MTLPADADEIAVELIAQTVTTALTHLAELQAHLGALDTRTDPAVEWCVDGCKEDAHHLLVDIVSLRNAVELLRRAHDDTDD